MRVLTEEQKARKAERDRARWARLKALGVNPRNVHGILIEETVAERRDRAKVARACATPFRDAYAHVRGGKFKHEAGEADAVARSVTDSMTGDVHHYRGTGFYAGRR